MAGCGFAVEYTTQLVLPHWRSGFLVYSMSYTPRPLSLWWLAAGDWLYCFSYLLPFKLHGLPQMLTYLLPRAIEIRNAPRCLATGSELPYSQKQLHVPSLESGGRSLPSLYARRIAFETSSVLGAAEQFPGSKFLHVHCEKSQSVRARATI